MGKACRVILLASAAIAVLTVTGCSKPVLDWRNAEVTDGTIYTPSANEPFSGVVTHVPDSFIFSNAPGYNRFMQEAGGDGYATARFLQAVMGSDSPNFYCRVSVRKGIVDGSATCEPPQVANTIIQAHFDGGRLSGKFVYYNPDKPDQKLIEGNFDQGQPDGKQTIYSASTGKMVEKIGWSNGVFDGNFAKYNASTGKVTIEGAFSGGKREGSWKQYSKDGEHLIAKGSYKQGLNEGVAEGFDPDTGNRTFLINKWVDGKIDGKKKTWDKDGKLLTDEIYADGNLVKSKDVSKDSGNQLVQALSGNVPAAAPAPTQADATTSAASTSSNAASLQACVQGWTDAHHAEAAKAGVDDAVTMDQLNEWQEWCKAGKQAPKA